MSAKMDSSYTNKGKQLVVQFSVKHEQDLDCGGAYIKVLPGLGTTTSGAQFGALGDLQLEVV